MMIRRLDSCFVALSESRGLAAASAQHAGLALASLEERRFEDGVRRMPVIGHRGQLLGLVSLDDVLAELAGEIQDVAGSIANEQRIEAALRR
jgi:hypothetical protein